MTAGTLADADGVAALLTWLRGHTGVLDAFGSAAHISGLNEAPYPHLRVAPGGGGSDRDLRWITDPEAAVEAYGDLDGTPGRAALWRLHRVALTAAVALPEGPYVANAAVVTRVVSSSPARWSPEPLTDQPAWRSTLLLTVHPPASVT